MKRPIRAASQATGLSREVSKRLQEDLPALAAVCGRVEAEARAIDAAIGDAWRVDAVGSPPVPEDEPRVLVDLARDVAFVSNAIGRARKRGALGRQIIEDLAALSLPHLVREFRRPRPHDWPSLSEDQFDNAAVALLHSALMVGDAAFNDHVRMDPRPVRSDRSEHDFGRRPLWVQVENGSDEIAYPLLWQERLLPPEGRPHPRRLFVPLGPWVPPRKSAAHGIAWHWFLMVHPPVGVSQEAARVSPSFLDLGDGYQGILMLRVLRKERAGRGTKRKARELLFVMTEESRGRRHPTRTSSLARSP